jgi:hypothetical protein
MKKPRPEDHGSSPFLLFNYRRCAQCKHRMSPFASMIVERQIGAFGSSGLNEAAGVAEGITVVVAATGVTTGGFTSVVTGATGAGAFVASFTTGATGAVPQATEVTGAASFFATTTT